MNTSKNKSLFTKRNILNVLIPGVSYKQATMINTVSKGHAHYDLREIQISILNG